MQKIRSQVKDLPYSREIREFSQTTMMESWECGETSMEKVISSIGEKIRKLRQDAGLSIQKLAEKSGVSPAGIYKIETNEMTPSITTLMKIAAALGKKVSYFVEENERVKNIEYTRAKDRKKVYNKESRILIESFAARLEDGRMYVGILTIKPGEGLCPRPWRTAGRSFFTASKENSSSRSAERPIP